MNKLKGIGATLSRPLSFNRATSMSFSSVRDSAECISPKQTRPGRIQVTDIDRESDANLMDLYERWMRHTGKIRTDEEKKRRFQAFKTKVMNMNLKNHRTLRVTAAVGPDHRPNTKSVWNMLTLEEWRARKSEFPHEETYEEMERRLFGRVKR
ncbi:hypothetical protein MKX01_027703 [Papaver californicum]|nr:hypothetical protein MKX01_027703 [Papaver californicum]